MPDSAERIAFQRQFSDEEYRLLQLGFIPLEHVDEFFAYFEDDTFYIYPLYAQGRCEYKLRLQQTGEGCEVEEAWIHPDSPSSKTQDENRGHVYLNSTINHLLAWIALTELPATRDNWKILPMPEARTRLAVEIDIPADRFERLRWGFIPRAMEDHWFYFMEHTRLHVHRSWTGFCIYLIDFEQWGDGYRVAQVWANRDLEQYRGDDEGDREWLQRFLFG